MCWWWYHGIDIFALGPLPMGYYPWAIAHGPLSFIPFSQYLNIDPARPMEVALIVEPALATEPALAE